MIIRYEIDDFLEASGICILSIEIGSECVPLTCIIGEEIFFYFFSFEIGFLYLSFDF
jgi:hypothetical protein